MAPAKARPVCTEPRTVKYADWLAEGEQLFGPDRKKWLFACPICGFAQSAETFEAAKLPLSAVGFSCIGRWLRKRRKAFGGEGEGPCDYAGGGLFAINPVIVTDDPAKPGGETRNFEWYRPAATP